jgi:hypothetical protein
VNGVDVPWWWSVDDEAQMRHRLEKLIEGGDVYELETVDHGVVVGYDGDRPVETAMSGLTRVGNHSMHGSERYERHHRQETDRKAELRALTNEL